MHWIIQIHLEGDRWFDLCKCDSIQSACEIVDGLTKRGGKAASSIRIVGVDIPL